MRRQEVSRLALTLLLSAMAGVGAVAAEDSLVNIAALARVGCEPAADGDSAMRTTDGRL